MEYRLDNINGMTADDIRGAIKQGARFHVFRYQVSLLALSLLRLSPAILIRNEEEFRKYKQKYNLITCCFGIWHPLGFYYLYKTMKVNAKGGFDASKDIELNLDHFDPANGKVELHKEHTLFNHLPVRDFTELKEAIQAYCEENQEIKEVYVGQLINEGSGADSAYMIGINTEMDKEELDKQIYALIYKRFNGFVRFHILISYENEDYFEKISTQGQAIKK